MKMSPSTLDGLFALIALLAIAPLCKENPLSDNLTDSEQYSEQERQIMTDLRSSAYFNIKTSEVKDADLLGYIKHNREDVEALLALVDYGRKVEAFYIGETNVLGEDNPFEELGRGPGVLDLVEDVTLVLGTLNQSVALTTFSGLIGNIALVLDAIEIYEALNIQFNAREGRALLKFYFQERRGKPSSETIDSSPEEAWDSILEDYDYLVIRSSALWGIPEENLHTFVENVFLAYRLVGEPNSEKIRYEAGEAIAEIARKS